MDDFGGFTSAPADSKAPAADEDKEEDLGLDDFGGFASAPADPKAPAADEDKRRIWGGRFGGFASTIQESEARMLRSLRKFLILSQTVTMTLGNLPAPIHEPMKRGW